MPKEKKDKHKGKGQKHPEDAAEETLLVALVEGDVEVGPNGADVADIEADEGEAALPDIFTPQLEGDYSAAFSDEIADAAFLQRAFLAQLPPGALFPHSGRVRLTETGLDFEGLVAIPFAEMVALHAHVDRVYHRYYAGLAALGGRGASSHHLTGAEPFVLTFRDGERERSLYALLDWPFFLALSKDKNWRKAVGGVLPAKEKKK
ncbi:MAG TPA: hypothetical protein VKT82_07310 [Ktedonobacterales bacterium]|nr:hypothetical protein [Ktedonobacterales bacterium]